MHAAGRLQRPFDEEFVTVEDIRAFVPQELGGNSLTHDYGETPRALLVSKQANPRQSRFCLTTRYRPRLMLRPVPGRFPGGLARPTREIVQTDWRAL